MRESLKCLLEVLNEGGSSRGQRSWPDNDDDVEAGSLLRQGSDAMSELSLQSIAIYRALGGLPTDDEAEAVMGQAVGAGTNREEPTVGAAAKPSHRPKGRFLVKALRPRQHY